MLSKIIIFVTRHNKCQIFGLNKLVVNCFQKLLSSWHDTTSRLKILSSLVLWIAFKNYYLRDTTQRVACIRLFAQCCELLSKIIIFVTRHNTSIVGGHCLVVVNCFQKLLSSWHDTTNLSFLTDNFSLWIAFKNYYLRDTTQLSVELKLMESGCELLSKIIIFVTRHNQNGECRYVISVVNCFQKLLSSWHDTTKVLYIIIIFGCELLSKIIIFVTRHN